MCFTSHTLNAVRAVVWWSSSPLPAAAAAWLRAPFCFLQALLVLMSQTFAARVSLWLELTVLGVSGLIWLGSTVYFMPNYTHRVNVINCVFAGLYMWTFVCLVLNNLYDETDAAVTLYVGSPFAAMTGYALANWRTSNIVKRAPSRLQNAYEVELYARYKLHAAIWGHPTDKLSADALAASVSASSLSVVSAMGSTAGKDGKEGSDGKDLVSGSGAGAGTLKRTTGPTANASNAAEQTETLAVDGFNAAAVAAAAGLGDPSAPGGVSPLTAPAALDEDTLDDLDERSAALRRAVPPRVLAEVTGLFRGSMARMRGSALLQLFLARHYAVWVGNTHLQHAALLAAERRRGALDVAFLVYSARRANEDAAGAGGAGGELSALARVAFDKHSADARRYVMLAAARQAAFWAELVQDQADLSRLHRLSSETNAAIASAETAFAELSAINSQAVAIMRLYAAFCLHVTCNNDKAAALTAEADRLEDAKSRDHRSEGNARLTILGESGLDLWTESTALLTLSARSAELGLIVSANTAACKMLGYSRLQLERRSAFTLSPKPLDRWLELALRRYAALGPEGNEVVGHTRILFACGKSGAIMPVLCSVRDAPGEDGQRGFLLIMRELRSVANYVLMNERFGLLAACASSLSLLGVETTALNGRDVNLGDFVSELAAPSVQAELATSAGALIRIDVRAPGGGNDEDEDDGDDGGDGNDDDSVMGAGSGGSGSGSEGDEEDDEGEEEDGRGRAGGAAATASLLRGSAVPGTVARRMQGTMQGGATPTAATASSTARMSSSRLARTSSRAGAGGPIIPRRGSTAMPALKPSGFAGSGDRVVSTWVRAHLQRIEDFGLRLQVLHFSRLGPGESFAAAKAEHHRQNVLAHLAGNIAAGAGDASRLGGSAAGASNAAVAIDIAASGAWRGGAGGGYTSHALVAASPGGGLNSVGTVHRMPPGLGGAGGGLQRTKSIRLPPLGNGGSDGSSGATMAIKGGNGFNAAGRRASGNASTGLGASLVGGAGAGAGVGIGSHDSIPDPSAYGSMFSLPGAVSPSPQRQQPQQQGAGAGAVGQLQQRRSSVNASQQQPPLSLEVDSELMDLLSTGRNPPASAEATSREGSAGAGEPHPAVDAASTATGGAAAAVSTGNPGDVTQQQSALALAAGVATASTDEGSAAQLIRYESAATFASAADLGPGAGVGAGAGAGGDAQPRVLHSVRSGTMRGRRNRGRDGSGDVDAAGMPISPSGGMRSPGAGKSRRLTVNVAANASATSAGGQRERDSSLTPAPAGEVAAPGSVARSAGKPAPSVGRRSHHAGSVDDRSEGSGSSRSTAAVRSLTRLRRVLSSDNQPLLPGLRLLLIVGIVLTVLAVGLAAIIVVIMRTSFVQYRMNAEYTALGSKRLLYKASALRSLQDIMFSARTFVPLPQHAIDEARTYVLGNTTLFTDSHKRMQDLAQLTDATDWQDPWVPVRLYDVPETSVTGNIVYFNLGDLGAYLAAQLEVRSRVTGHSSTAATCWHSEGIHSV